MKPHKCPVCNGRGRVSPGFYNAGMKAGVLGENPTCRSCDGKGIVWESEPSPLPVVEAIGMPFLPTCRECGRRHGESVVCGAVNLR